MAHPGILMALCAIVFAAVDGSAQTAPAVEAPAAPCRFTLERDAVPVADHDETWLLTCHHEPAAPVQPVVERRVVRPAAPQAATVTPTL
jgi:hypothetical protein